MGVSFYAGSEEREGRPLLSNGYNGYHYSGY